jgi:hypothetical protein
MLANHSGPAAVMSFDPLLCQWFARHAPAIPRGMVLSRRHRRGILSRRTIALAMARARPHFLACDQRDLPRAAHAWPRAGGRPLFAWTICNPMHRARALRHGAQLIFEGAGRPEPDCRKSG